MKIYSYILSTIWYIASILIIYLAVILSKKYHFLQFKILKMISSLKSKSKNDISPIASLYTSLAAKIGVGSLSGMAIAIYYGGVGTIFWFVLIGLFVSINTYMEVYLGIKYHQKINNKYYGGPSYYINKILKKKKLSTTYSILTIITYSFCLLPIQSNTIFSVTSSFNINHYYILMIMIVVTLIIISKGIKRISQISSILVPIMTILYLVISIYIILKNISFIPTLILYILKEALKLRSIIPTILISMQRAIFATESSTGTSAISASTCDNLPEKQALIEIFGNYLIIVIICLGTSIAICTTDYNKLELTAINGIELVLYAFKYHFGSLGKIILSVITIMFAYSTIISSYYFAESNIVVLNKNQKNLTIYKITFLVVIIASFFIKSIFLWNIADLFIALLVIINTYALIIVNKYHNLC